jgi:hypothetical protein
MFNNKNILLGLIPILTALLFSFIAYQNSHDAAILLYGYLIALIVYLTYYFLIIKLWGVESSRYYILVVNGMWPWILITVSLFINNNSHDGKYYIGTFPFIAINILVFALCIISYFRKTFTLKHTITAIIITLFLTFIFGLVRGIPGGDDAQGMMWELLNGVGIVFSLFLLRTMKTQSELCPI